jgi:hypothetical protein
MAILPSLERLIPQDERQTSCATREVSALTNAALGLWYIDENRRDFTPPFTRQMPSFTVTSPCRCYLL